MIVFVVLGLSTVVGLLWKVADGRVRESQPEEGALLDVLGELGATAGSRATLLQFSSAFCAPCRATRTLLAHVAEQEDGVVHVEVDAEQHLELVRRLDIAKTPTTLVLDGAGREVRRAVGAPRSAAVIVDAISALGS